MKNSTRRHQFTSPHHHQHLPLQNPLTTLTPNRITHQPPSFMTDTTTQQDVHFSLAPWFPQDLSFSEHSIHTNELPSTAATSPTKSPPRTYANVATSPPSTSSPSTTKHQADEELHNNINNTLRFWLTAEATPTSVIRDLSKSLNRAPEDILFGVHKDTRIKSAHKFDVIFRSKAIRDQVYNKGVTINNKHLKPSLPTPRPPPSTRAYLQNQYQEIYR